MVCPTSSHRQLKSKCNTAHMPLILAEDNESQERYFKALPRATVGPSNYLIDVIGKFKDAGAEEIIRAPFENVEVLQPVVEKIVAAFD